ncbi:uncharacterized protein DUF4386 [Kribbella sp. VKM Ac-2527]|uniref:Uncharacterized protein DUF4386 n=1 Tax=Kribbella caucasensis TaxID=2512215 RepID=A0A4R6JGM1_9ACTN|nr:DUF4386 family protein [Kribbella sp. VKM Ac-2527]TDO35174.1 uncharacterized protein DUF4386 [Kribbella sp. VKM Ac-2527]
MVSSERQSPPTDGRSISLKTMSGVFLVALGRLLEALRLLGTGPDEQVLLEIDAFTDLWGLGLGLFGCHLLVIGYLAYRSGYVPRVLGVLLAVAGLGYLADLGPWSEISTYTFIGEFLLALWLVIRGRRVAPIRAMA